MAQSRAASPTPSSEKRRWLGAQHAWSCIAYPFRTLRYLWQAFRRPAGRSDDPEYRRLEGNPQADNSHFTHPTRPGFGQRDALAAGAGLPPDNDQLLDSEAPALCALAAAVGAALEGAAPGADMNLAGHTGASSASVTQRGAWYPLIQYIGDPSAAAMMAEAGRLNAQLQQVQAQLQQQRAVHRQLEQREGEVESLQQDLKRALNEAAEAQQQLQQQASSSQQTLKNLQAQLQKARAEHKAEADQLRDSATQLWHELSAAKSEVQRLQQRALRAEGQAAEQKQVSTGSRVLQMLTYRERQRSALQRSMCCLRLLAVGDKTIQTPV